MKARLLSLRRRVLQSFWFVPALMSLAAIALSTGAGWLDGALHQAEDGWQGALARWLLYAGDVAGSRTVLSTIAASMMTVTGVTFSITMVALSLASQQFGPRLLSSFMSDRGTQVVLGTFVSTFLFCGIALGTRRGDPELVQAASATAAVVLAVASVGVLIYFIHHVAASIRAEAVMRVVYRDLQGTLDLLVAREDEGPDAPPPIGAPSRTVRAPASGYLQGVDEDALVAVAAEEDVRLVVAVRPGHFVVEGEPVAEAHDGPLPDRAAALVERALVLGRERTGEQDPEFGLFQLAELAVRALSPGVNDPHTAIACVDWLGASLARVADRPLRPAALRDGADRARVWIPRPSFAGLVDTAFDEIRQCSGGSPSVVLRLLETLAVVGRRAEGAERRDAVRRQVEMVHRPAAERLVDHDLRDLDARYRAALASLER